MKTRLQKILEQEKDVLFLDPDGNLIPQSEARKLPYSTQGQEKLVINKRVRLLHSFLDDYIYSPRDGTLLVNDEDINQALRFSNYQNNINGTGDSSSAWRKKVREFKTLDPDENKYFEFISTNYRQRGGGQIVADGRLAPTLGNTFFQTGGMKYTFGIELETTAGVLTHDDLLVGNFSMEGDRTIQAYEYVSNIMAGDAGINKIKKLASALEYRTILGDGNGLHIHIGGYRDYGKLWTPQFNRAFSINAIKLGNQIEDEMLALINPLRRKEKYLKSIKPWAAIDGENWREVLGDYVFAGSNDVFRAEENYETHKLDDKHNTSFSISRWAKTKHKWMNLNHCNANSHVKTIEFRLFSATSSQYKIKNFIVLCMAIVWFIENRQRLIWQGGVTINKIIEEAMGNKQSADKALRELKSFIAHRKQLFNV